MRQIPIKLGALALALMTFGATAQAPGDVRVALIIGNSAYAGAAALQNPVNDATAMAASLKGLGFNVIELRDGSLAQMGEAITRVRDTLRGKQGIGMLYYAGHGLQLDWHNYMVPVDAKLNTAADVPGQTVDIDKVIDAFRVAGNRMNILVLDACRDNPFAGTGSGKGLAQLDAPPGTFLAYATAPGNVAEDGDDGGNGLYTGFLVRELSKPAAKIEDVFKRVRLQVRQRSGGRQIPWESTSLEDDFYFNDGTRFTMKVEDLQRLAAEARQKEQRYLEQVAQARERERLLAQQLAQEQEREKQRQAEAAARESEAQRRAAEAQARERERQIGIAQQQERERAAAAAKAAEEVRRLEQARQAEVERARAEAEAAAREKLSRAEAADKAFIREKVEWDRIKNSRNADDFYEFVKKYPGSSIAEAALDRLDRLSAALVVPTPAKGRESEAGMPRRPRVGDSRIYEYRDGLSKVVLRRETQTVTAIKDETIEINGGAAISTLSGAVLRNDQGIQFDPPLISAPSGGPQVGKKWVSRTRQTRASDNLDGWLEQEFKITAYEDVTVIAGSFKAYRVESRLRAQNGLSGTITYWVAPGVGQVKLVREARVGNRLDFWTRELVSFTRAEG